MTSVRAKFTCTSKTEDLGDVGTAQFAPVTEGSEENEKFFRWTPSGHIQLGTINGAALAQFKVGAEYYIDFTPAKSTT